MTSLRFSTENKIFISTWYLQDSRHFLVEMPLCYTYFAIVALNKVHTSTEAEIESIVGPLFVSCLATDIGTPSSVAQFPVLFKGTKESMHQASKSHSQSCWTFTTWHEHNEVEGDEATAPRNGSGPRPKGAVCVQSSLRERPRPKEATARPDCGRVGVKIAAAEQISTEWGWQTAGLRWCEVERTQDMLAHTVDALCHHYQPQQQRQRWWKWESDYGCAEVLEWLRINNGSCREFRLLLWSTSPEGLFSKREKCTSKHEEQVSSLWASRNWDSCMRSVKKKELIKWIQQLVAKNDSNINLIGDNRNEKTHFKF